MDAGYRTGLLKYTAVIRIRIFLKRLSMRTPRLLLTIGLLAAPFAVNPALGADDGFNACHAKPTAQCLADMAFAVGQTLPEQEAARYRLAAEQSKQNLKDGLDQLLAQGGRPLSVADHVSHYADLGDFAKARALLAAQNGRADRAQGHAALAASEAVHRHLRDARDDLRKAAALARKLKGQDADLYAHYAAQAQLELGSDGPALETAGHISDASVRFQTLLALSQRQWELKRKDAARASLTAAESSPGADALAVARQWRLFGDEEGFRRALETAEKHLSNDQDDAAARDLSSIALDLKEGGDVIRIHDRISRLPDPAWRAQSLVTLADAMPPAQSADAAIFLSEAADISTRLSNPAEKEALESQLVHGFALLGDRAQATRHLSQLKDPKRRADAFIDLGGLLAPKDKSGAAALFDQAKDEIQRQPEQEDQDLALRDLIWAERRAGLDDLARQLPEQIVDPLHKLLAHAELGDWPTFDKQAKTAKPSDHDLQAIAAGHAIDGRFGDVLETVKRIGSPALKAETLASAATLAAQLAP